jgi:hypothetical protein
MIPIEVALPVLHELIGLRDRLHPDLLWETFLELNHSHLVLLDLLWDLLRIDHPGVMFLGIRL